MLKGGYSYGIVMVYRDGWKHWGSCSGDISLETEVEKIKE